MVVLGCLSTQRHFPFDRVTEGIPPLVNLTESTFLVFFLPADTRMQKCRFGLCQSEFLPTPGGQPRFLFGWTDDHPADVSPPPPPSWAFEFIQTMVGLITNWLD